MAYIVMVRREQAAMSTSAGVQYFCEPERTEDDITAALLFEVSYL